MSNQLKTLVAIAFLISGVQAQAGLIVDVVSTDPSTGAFTKITPPNANLSNYDGISFKDGNNQALDYLLPGSTSPTDGPGGWGDNWWSPNTYTIFTTGLPSDSSKIVIDFSSSNKKVYGFSFQIGANKSATGWVEAFVGTTGTRVNNIGISPTNSPGIQITNMAGSCDAITKVVVEPPFTWGIFNMGMDTTGASCTQVPEPGSLSLLGVGLLGLGLMQIAVRRRLKAVA